ncbi:uncharacterized protein [Oscarella lobularis]|uniref:uncharacterized protein isoform X2 n=1 Tax=Oscarella lobularis TaxID=121494 RepID=UPI003313DAAA
MAERISEDCAASPPPEATAPQTIPDSTAVAAVTAPAPEAAAAVAAPAPAVAAVVALAALAAVPAPAVAAAAAAAAAKRKTRNCCGENCGRAWTRFVRELCHLVVGQSYYPLLKNKEDKVEQRLRDIESQVNPKLSHPDKEKRRVESRDRCLAWSARIFGGVLLFLVFSSFFLVRFNEARKKDVKSQEWHTVDYSKEGMEFPKIVICENMKQISCSLNENGLLGEQRRSHSCTQPYVQKIKLYERNCLVYGNKSGGLPPQIATSASTTLRLVIDVGTHDGRLETPWNGAFMLIQNPFLASPPDFSAGLVRTYVLSPNVYHLVEMKRRAVYSPPVHTAFDGKKYSPPNNGFFRYIVNTPESGPLSKLYAARYNSQTIAVIDFQFTTLEQENIVEEKVASLFNFLIGLGGLAGLITVGYIILSFVLKLCALYCCPDGYSCEDDKNDDDKNDAGKPKTSCCQCFKNVLNCCWDFIRSLFCCLCCKCCQCCECCKCCECPEDKEKHLGGWQSSPPEDAPNGSPKFYICCCCCVTEMEAPGDYDVV